MVRARLVVLLFALTALVGCDHVTKHWAETNLSEGPSIVVVDGVLRLHYTQNYGIGFNLLDGLPKPWRVAISALLATVGALFVLLWWRKRSAEMRRRYQRSWFEHAAFALLLSGALGNQVDRLFRGYVVDFIHLTHWPVFNVADGLIAMGLVLLVFFTIRSNREACPTSGSG